MRASIGIVLSICLITPILLTGCPPRQEAATPTEPHAPTARGPLAGGGGDATDNVPATAAAGNAEGAHPSATTKSELTIGIAMTWGHPYWQNMIQGFKDEAAAQEKKTGKQIELVWANAEEDASKQISQCQDMVSKGVDAVAMVPVQEEASVRGVWLFNEANIPVVLVNRQVKDTTGKAHWVCYTGTDTYQGAKVSAELLMKALGGKGDIVELQQVLGSNPQVQRSKALQDTLKAYPAVKLVAQESFGAEEAKAVGIMENLLSAHPGITGVYAHGDNAAIFALKACEAKQRGDIKIVGMGGSTEALRLIKEGKLVGTSYQQPYQEGRMGLRFVMDHLTGKAVKPYVPTEVLPVTKENAAQFKGQF